MERKVQPGGSIQLTVLVCRREHDGSSTANTEQILETMVIQTPLTLAVRPDKAAIHKNSSVAGTV